MLPERSKIDSGAEGPAGSRRTMGHFEELEQANCGNRVRTEFQDLSTFEAVSTKSPRDFTDRQVNDKY